MEISKLFARRWCHPHSRACMLLTCSMCCLRAGEAGLLAFLPPRCPGRLECDAALRNPRLHSHGACRSEQYPFTSRAFEPDTQRDACTQHRLDALEQDADSNALRCLVVCGACRRCHGRFFLSTRGLSVGTVSTCTAASCSATAMSASPQALAYLRDQFID
eukprot:6202264-Pleurochrysis_carterae.AAC.2